MSPLPHPGTFSFWSQCRIGSWTLSFDSVWQVGEMDWLMNFILFERKKLCHLRRTQKYSRNISVVFWLFLVQWEDAVFVFIFVFARSETIFLSHSCIRWLNYKYHSVLCNRAAVLGKDWLVQSCLQEFRLYYPPLMLGKFKRVVFCTINAQLWNWKLKHKWFLKETAKKKNQLIMKFCTTVWVSFLQTLLISAYDLFFFPKAGKKAGLHRAYCKVNFLRLS